MKTTDSTVLEAYVIEDDGTKTAVPAGFADRMPRSRDARQTREAGAYDAHNPYATREARARRPLHLGRRMAGVAIALIGVPLLILPGPGLALVGLGLLMAVMP